MSQPLKIQRCPWGDTDDLYRRYHDQEWGVPLYDSDKLFGLLVLEGMQAGLSWRTILGKRESITAALEGLNPSSLAKMSDEAIIRLIQRPSSDIIRSRAKLFGARNNARAYIELSEREDSSAWLWQFIGGSPVTNHYVSMSEVPAYTAESTQMAKALKKLRFVFVGPTICYAYMQSAGMVNDHLTSCFRYQACRRLAEDLPPPEGRSQQNQQGENLKSAKNHGQG